MLNSGETNGRVAQPLKPGDFNGTTEVVPFPFVLSLDEVALPSNKVKGSGQECPLHMGWDLIRLRSPQWLKPN
jgi:hypothetical protein